MKDAADRMTPDMFVADLLDVSFKDDRETMEHPVYSLSKKPDTAIRTYEFRHASEPLKDVTIVVTPSAVGHATIWDKDILIYAVSQLREALNRGKEISRVIHVAAFDLLSATNRSTGGSGYDHLTDALTRLGGTQVMIETRNAKGKRHRESFSLLESWAATESQGERLVSFTVTLSERLYRMVLDKKALLTISPEYFKLTGGLERRIYEIGRRQLGKQAALCAIGLDKLYHRSGSTAPMKEFTRMVKKIVEANNLPDIGLRYDAQARQLTFYPRDPHKLFQAVARLAGGSE